MIDGETIAVVTHTWRSIVASPASAQFVGERLLYNYLMVFPPIRSYFPLPQDGLFTSSSFAQCASQIVTEINKVMTILENQRHPRFRAVLGSCGKKLTRYGIYPCHYNTAWFALIETLQDVLEEGFTELMLAYWVDIIEPLNTVIAKGIRRPLTIL
mmetsp:Transcript_2046/g.2578  ORF Transcript_2046/g.2578 Transcript_2046/m.2578 type:complete len:156 (-) Transcript_2046:183-650(-)|eukprot:CAMPEP_0172517396 /NCGR_PEP_ID=MMETSP1066-20121228/284752_1 /TAXON_ID=671091 /ORGANISM="Coscinodiscus wailesii, Strain CCMP2513" /LENGTH=155 /DNA_ID=CAMNT_0013299385 /DNA_START=166 /DNA_END=633 /DNA_ORIENTATION=+